MLKRIVHMRIEKITENHLLDGQYGFRKRRSIRDVINLVVNIARKVLSDQIWKNSDKPYCAVVTVDIENALNTSKWYIIMEALERMETP